MAKDLTYFEAHKRASSFLKEKGKEEAALLFVFLEKVQWDKTTWLLKMREPISKEHQELLKEITKKLLEDLPPQYILGYSEFLDNQFKVTKDTLIPRSETEELVMKIIKEEEKYQNSPLKVVDIGTGSGVIAISLKQQFPNWQVFAGDISKNALKVAKENADTLHQEVTFKKSDVLKGFNEKFDIIVSNPPYISENEKAVMDESVLKYEPENALFAENNGLAIYERIAKESKSKLKPDGRIYLEIGYLQKRSVEDIFKKAFPKKVIKTYQDLSGLDRMVVVKNKE